MTLDRITAGRKTTSSQKTVSVGTSSGSFLLASPKRVAIIVSAPLTNRFTLSLDTTAVLDAGLTLQPQSNSITLTLAKHGDLVTRPWTAISATSSQSVSVIEVFAGM